MAEEVRKLASESNKSATDMQTVIKTIQKGIEDVSNNVQVNLMYIQKGTKLIFLTKQVFEETTQSTHSVSKEINDITHASSSLLNHSEETKEILEQFADITYAFAETIVTILSTTEQQALSSNELNQVADSFQSWAN